MKDKKTDAREYLKETRETIRTEIRKIKTTYDIRKDTKTFNNIMKKAKNKKTTFLKRKKREQDRKKAHVRRKDREKTATLPEDLQRYANLDILKVKGDQEAHVKEVIQPEEEEVMVVGSVTLLPCQY